VNLRDLLVVLDGSPRDDIKLAVAVGLARRFDAHLTGVCPLELLVPADMAFALGGYPDLWALPEFAKQIEGQSKAKAAVIEAKFRELLRREGVNGDWVFETGSLIRAVTLRSHAADLVVLGQADPDNPLPEVGRTMVEDLLMTAGRPLLIIPYAGQFEAIGSNTLVGWTATREAARAVHDALPLLACSVGESDSAERAIVQATTGRQDASKRRNRRTSGAPWTGCLGGSNRGVRWAVARRCVAGLCLGHQR
jgi:hypothetical protein